VYCREAEMNRGGGVGIVGVVLASGHACFTHLNAVMRGWKATSMGSNTPERST
jgi:hypothetical protein